MSNACDLTWMHDAVSDMIAFSEVNDLPEIRESLKLVLIEIVKQNLVRDFVDGRLPYDHEGLSVKNIRRKI
ncbi:hypothetical protein Q9299_19895 [Gemmobacter fulvus]|uniref:hypothetical protein n=1 Tax=Gemmobacter fulvus TaxID=2840474 RepID=UPI0027965181|nr:hypothetical protein [Gemmobacter fulvus]MDQ1850572.1 hypothetical protein [Gemmobacter fulvus]